MRSRDAGRSMVVLQATPASDGVAIGRAVCLAGPAHEVFRLPLQEADVPAELERLTTAIRTTHEEIDRTSSKVGEQVGAELAAIFDAHHLILDDVAFVGRIREVIEAKKVNAEWAVQRVSEQLGEQFARIENELLRERGEDLRDVTRYLLRSLQGISHHELSEIEGPVLIVADELTPSEALHLGRANVAGFATSGGGATSHTTIVARALNLPLVTGLAGITDLVNDEALAVIDGTAGYLILHPTDEVLTEHRRRRERSARQHRDLASIGEAPIVTTDGTAIDLRANVEIVEELGQTLALGAHGIGLYRSEFLYIEKSPALPTEDEQYEVICQLLEAMAPHPVIVRTFDLGGRKLARDVSNVVEENPNLGLRGIRLTLARLDVFKTQIRALLRAAREGELRVMLPLVSSLHEIRAFRKVCREVHEELKRDGVAHEIDFPLGTMIEVPAAALIAGHIAREVDFMAVGTNDLIQYALAVDRNNEHVASLYKPLHPAVLTMIRDVVAAGAEADIEVSVCGEMAGVTKYVPLLLGLGVRSLSMSPRKLPAVAQQIRELDCGVLHGVAQRCCEMATAGEVETYLARVNTAFHVATS